MFASLCDSYALVLDDSYFSVLHQVTDSLVKQLHNQAVASEGSHQPPKLVVSVSGGQGSGKSTFSMMLAAFLSNVAGILTQVISLDDFYLTKAERQALTNISSLLQTRGAPGTHDIEWLGSVLTSFRQGQGQGQDQEVTVPVFSKANDDRLGTRPVDLAATNILIVEGWCWGAKPIAVGDLEPPINELERQEDADCQWRQYMAASLVEYQAVFNADIDIYLKVPDLEAVYRWRHQQELRIENAELRMNEPQLRRFLMHYERVTQQLLERPPNSFDAYISLDQNHTPTLERLNI